MSSSFRKIVLAIGAYLIIFVAIIVFALKPSLDGLRQNRQKVSSKQTDLNQIYDKLDYLQKISKNPQDLESNEKIVNNYWPDSSDISQFIIQTENLANNNNLVLDNVSINEIKNTKTSSNKKDNSSNGSQFSLSLKSSYPSILNFIKGMETLPRFNSISLINLSGTTEGSINVQLTGTVYYGK